MRIRVIKRIWGTPVGNITKYVILKDGMPFKEYSESEYRMFMKALLGRLKDG